jgi:glycosyltransferase involved in cell wall biosynthesis
MRVVQIHNQRMVQGGSEVMFDSTISLLQEFGHEVVVFKRANSEIADLKGKIKAAVSGIYSSKAKADLENILASIKPDIVHVHNLYPLLSPSILDACHNAAVPVVMRLSDFTLICPTSHHFREGAICERCLGGREYQCVLTNCRGNLTMSVAYAVRTTIARLRRCFIDKVTFFIAPTNFVRCRFIEAGFPSWKIKVIPNMVRMPRNQERANAGTYIGYVGRVSPEKGIDVLLRAAAVTGLPVRIAGDISAAPGIRERAPANVQFVTELKRTEIAEFVGGARFCIVPSICLETFSLACAEIMTQGIPVIASRIGGLPELVSHLENGVLVEPGNVEDLSEWMKKLWNNQELVALLGAAAARKATTEYSSATYYDRLLMLYQAAVGKPNP